MPASDEDTLTILKRGKIEVEGEFLWGSNYTFLANVEHEDRTLAAVYKPIRGERPLWDFPASTLALREVAAYLVSQALGWRLVPPTVYRKKGPVGPGSLQLFVEHDPEYHYFNFRPEHQRRLRPTALFDVLINNADRKGSHILIDPDDHIWLIDHGVCFHVEDKLRTVVWDFAGEPLPDKLCSDLIHLREKLGINNSRFGRSDTQLVSNLSAYISRDEIRALDKRAQRIVAMNKFPPPNPYRRPYPWPQI